MSLDSLWLFSWKGQECPGFPDPFDFTNFVVACVVIHEISREQRHPGIHAPRMSSLDLDPVLAPDPTFLDVTLKLFVLDQLTARRCMYTGRSLPETQPVLHRQILL